MPQPAYGDVYPFEDPDNQAGDAAWRHIGAAWGDGIINDVDGTAFAVAPSGADRTIVVTLGEVRVRGIHFQPNDPNVTITLSAVSGGFTRADRIIAHLDPTDESITIVKSEGSAVATPATPALAALARNSGGTWDLPLWRFTGGNTAANTLTKVDDRSWAGSSGLVSSSGAMSPNDPIGRQMTALDTGQTWIRKLVSGTPTWVNRDVPTALALPLAGSAGTLIPFNSPPVYRNVRGLVTLQGTVKRSSGAPLISASYPTDGSSDPLLATLPVGSRPSGYRYFEVSGIGGGARARLYISPAGQILLNADGLNITAVGLDPITFYAEQ